MKYSLLLFSILFSSCGLFMPQQSSFFPDGNIPNKDTIIVRPFEHFYQAKGYSAHEEYCNCSGNSNITVSIKGYETTDTLPYSALNDTLRLSFSNENISMVDSGKISLYTFSSGGATKEIRSKNVKEIFFGFRFYERLRKKKLKPPVLLLYCFKVNQAGKVLCLPTRQYFFK